MWASTSVKNPAYPDARYVVDLVALGVVNTMPEATLRLVADHGQVPADSIHGHYEESQQLFDQLRGFGIDYDDVAQNLEGDGVAAFDSAWERLGEQLATTLSKEHLLGKAERDTIYVHPPQWYTKHDVDLRLGVTVTGIHPGPHEVSVADGSRLAYAKPLATGPSPRRLSVPGADLDGVLYLRSVGDSDRIRAAFASAPRAAVIGGGWIGLETAAAAHAAAGVEVTLLEREELPLLRVLAARSPRTSPTCTEMHGVDLRCRVRSPSRRSLRPATASS